MFYSRVLSLCESKGMSIFDLIRELQISKSNATNWKNGTIPHRSTVKKIADYFSVSIESLLAKEVVMESDTMDEQTRKIINDPDLHQYILMGIEAKEKGLSPEVLRKIIGYYTK